MGKLKNYEIDALTTRACKILSEKETAKATEALNELEDQGEFDVLSEILVETNEVLNSILEFRKKHEDLKSKCRKELERIVGLDSRISYQHFDIQELLSEHGRKNTKDYSSPDTFLRRDAERYTEYSIMAGRVKELIILKNIEGIDNVDEFINSIIVSL